MYTSMSSPSLVSSLVHAVFAPSPFCRVCSQLIFLSVSHFGKLCGGSHEKSINAWRIRSSLGNEVIAEFGFGHNWSPVCWLLHVKMFLRPVLHHPLSTKMKNRSLWVALKSFPYVSFAQSWGLLMLSLATSWYACTNITQYYFSFFFFF